MKENELKKIYVNMIDDFNRHCTDTKCNNCVFRKSEYVCQKTILHGLLDVIVDKQYARAENRKARNDFVRSIKLN